MAGCRRVRGRRETEFPSGASRSGTGSIPDCFSARFAIVGFDWKTDLAFVDWRTVWDSALARRDPIRFVEIVRIGPARTFAAIMGAGDVVSSHLSRLGDVVLPPHLSQSSMRFLIMPIQEMISFPMQSSQTGHADSALKRQISHDRSICQDPLLFSRFKMLIKAIHVFLC